MSRRSSAHRTGTHGAGPIDNNARLARRIYLTDLSFDRVWAREHYDLRKTIERVIVLRRTRMIRSRDQKWLGET
jgi:hypothetical protein